MYRKSLLPLAALLLCSPPGSAAPDDDGNFVVTDNTGTQLQKFNIDNVRKIVFIGDKVSIVRHDGTASDFNWDDLHAIRFDVVSTSISTIETVREQVRIYVGGSTLFITGLPEGDTQASIYDLGGRLRLMTNVSEGSGIDISLLNKGIYIIRTKHTSLKFRL